MTDTRTDALKSLKLFAGAFQPSRMPSHDYEPTRQDAVDLVNDLLVFAKYGDKFIKSVADYCLEMGFITENQVKKYGTDIIENALIGNLLFCIEDGIQKRIDERAA